MSKPKLEIEPSEVTQILLKCGESGNQIQLLSEVYHLVYGGPKNLWYNSPALTEIRTPMNNTVLHIAALHGNDESVTFIIEHAPKLLFKFNKNNDSVLHVAARGGHVSTVKVLLASYAYFERRDIAIAWLEYNNRDINNDNLEAYDNMENMKDLLKFVNEKNFKGNTMLHEAVLCRNKKSIDDRLVDIFKICELYDTKDWCENSLSTLCYEYALNIVNHAKKSVLYIAVENGYKDAVKLILEKTPKNDDGPQGLSPVVAAIMKCNTEMLWILLERMPIWIHSSDKHERLPLHYAASIGYLEGVDLLLGKCKCCTIQRDKYGYFPIHLASYSGKVQVVKKLLEYCPDSTEMLDTFYGHNILHIASNYGKHEVVHYILQSKNREYYEMINQQDNNGDTPLHLAARSCHPKVVYYLVNHQSVNLDLVNKNNQTARDIVNSFYMLDRSSLRQYLTWIALTSAGAKQSPTDSLAVVYTESKQSDSPKKTEQSHVEESSLQSGVINLVLEKGPTTYKDKVQTLLLVSTLIVTASVAACFAVPGEADGKANNLCHTMFQVFIIFITISLFSAISSTIILLWETLGLTELVTFSLYVSKYLLAIALISLSLAFMAGLYTVISELTWLANVFLSITVTFVVVVICLYMFFFIPSKSTHLLLRYISHYPYLFLASIC